jgi:pimeloyl-ACP methyl ester carboxylesterase
MGEYVDVGGMKTWFDSWGSGPPVLLMHGGLSSNVEWQQHAPAFAEHFQVFAPERRGHGHTPDVEGPITYALMAQDTIGFLETVVGGPAHLVGWSDGGIVGLLVAMQRPDLVNKLVPISANFDVSGAAPEILEGASSMTAEGPEMEFFRSQYQSMSPDGADHWPIVFAKVLQMFTSEPTIDPKELRGITAPTLVVAADDDMVRLEHTNELYRSIPESQLAIVPGTSHMLVFEKADLLDGLIIDFLRNDQTPTMMPIRRAPAEGNRPAQ